MKENVIQYINSALNSIGRSRKKSDLDARREIQMAVVSSSTEENHLVKSMAQELGTCCTIQQPSLFLNFRNKSDLYAHREIQMAVVSSITKENCLEKYMAKSLGTSQKTLHRYKKFQLQIDVNDELTCLTVICK